MPRASSVPASADVVIIGGGVVGTSAAFHLAEAGASVVLLERDQLGSGSTSKAAGGVRAQFSDPLNIRIAQRSLAAFKDFGRRPGWEIDLHEVGYLFLLTREQEVEAFTRNVALQNELGVPSRMISAAEARELSPLLEVDDVLAASYSPEDGHATPEAVVQGYAYGARELGASMHTGHEVDRIERANGRITAVRAGATTVRTDTVICAAGAWSRRCGELAGVALPVSPLRRQVLFTEPMDGLPARIPLTIDFTSTFYFHREGPGLLFGMSDPTELPGFSIETTDGWIPRLLEIAEQRAPRVAATGIQRRLGGPVRHEPGPQRDHRRGRTACRASCTPPASPGTASCRGRRPASCCATSCCAAPRSSTSPRSAWTASTAQTCGPSSTSSSPCRLLRTSTSRPTRCARRSYADASSPASASRRSRSRRSSASRAARSATRCGCERDGLVAVIPNRGAVVPEIHAVDVLEVYALRAALGSLALHKLLLEGAIPVTALERALTACAPRSTWTGPPGRRRGPRLPVRDHRQLRPEPRHQRVRRLTWQVRIFIVALELTSRTSSGASCPSGGAARRDHGGPGERRRGAVAREVRALGAHLVERLPEEFDERLWTR